MRYFSYNEPPDKIITVSEDSIIKDYYPYWYKLMCEKYGKAHVDEHYCKLDCIDDWIVVHWAWEVDEQGKDMTVKCKDCDYWGNVGRYFKDYGSCGNSGFIYSGDWVEGQIDNMVYSEYDGYSSHFYTVPDFSCIRGVKQGENND